MKFEKRQIFLDRKPITKSKNFLKNIYQSGKIEGGRIFDMCDNVSFRRKHNKKMNLEKYLSLDWSERHIRLQIGSPAPDRLIYCAAVKMRETVQFAWLDCPLTEINYKEVMRAFKQAYGGNMIKIYIFDNPNLCTGMKDRSQAICNYSHVDLEIMAENKLPRGGLPDGYDLYSLHVSLVRPFEEHIINLRRSNPEAYILIRNTISSINNISKECRNSANEWCDGWISGSLINALEEIIKKKERES